MPNNYSSTGFLSEIQLTGISIRVVRCQMFKGLQKMTQNRIFVKFRRYFKRLVIPYCPSSFSIYSVPLLSTMNPRNRDKWLRRSPWPQGRVQEDRTSSQTATVVKRAKRLWLVLREINSQISSSHMNNSQANHDRTKNTHYPAK